MKTPICPMSRLRMEAISTMPLANPMREVPTMSLTIPFLAGLKTVACTAKTQNHRMAPFRLWTRRLQYMPASTHIWSRAMNWMMRALQKRSESQPTNGENRMKGSTIMAPSGYSRSPSAPYSQTPRGISRN